MLGRPVSPPTELRLMIRPPSPASTSARPTARAKAAAPSRLTRRTSSHSDSGHLRVGDIAGDGRDRPREARRELVEGGGRAGHQHHAAAAGDDAADDLRADPARGPGDDDGASVEAEGVGHGPSVYPPPYG